MPVREVIIIPHSSPLEHEQDLEHNTNVFRSLGFNIRFGIVSETNLPVIISAPCEVAEASSFGCLFSDLQRKDLSTAYSVYSSTKPRIFEFKETPALPDEFNAAQFLACETVGHASLRRACFEVDTAKREKMLSTAYRIYEGAILATCHSALLDMIKTVSKTDPRSVLFQTIPDMDTFTADWRRMISHSFAGMAICVLLSKDGNQKKFMSLVSASICCEARRPLELAAVLRFLPFLMYNTFYTVPSDSSQEREIISSLARVYSMYKAVSDNVLLPCMLTSGRRDLFNTELGFLDPRKRADAQRFAEAICQHTINRRAAPSPLTYVRTHIVNGQVLDRKCAACGVWDRSGKSHSRCARCMLVYYCCKECQMAHWKEHKPDCRKK